MRPASHPVGADPVSHGPGNAGGAAEHAPTRSVDGGTCHVFHAFEAGESIDVGEDRDQVVRIPSQRRGVFEAVPYADVLWIEATQNYTRMQVPGRPAVIVRRTMADWEAVLPADQFARISRSLLVQIPRIRSTQWQSRDQMLVFFEGSEGPLPIGRTPMARLKECLQRS